MPAVRSADGNVMTNTIHRFIQGGEYIVVDVNSGGVHVVDKLVYDMIGLLEPPLSEKVPERLLSELGEYPADDVRECYGEIYSLYKDKILFSEDDYRKYADIAVKAPIKAMCLHVSHDCNLRCRYCFASTGDFGTGRKIMTPETGRKAIDFLIEKSMGDRTLSSISSAANRSWHGRPSKLRWTMREASRNSTARTSVLPSPPTVCCSTTKRSTT